MKKSLLITSFIALLAFGACKDDEPAIDPIVGEWELDRVEYATPPSGFVWITFGSGDRSIVGESSYEMEFLADMTYEREVRFSSGGNAEDEGTWEKDDTELDLDDDDSTDDFFLYTSFEISDETDDDDLVLVVEDGSWPALTLEFVEAYEATVDTTTSDESRNTILSDNSVPKSMELTLTFERQ